MFCFKEIYKPQHNNSELPNIPGTHCYVPQCKNMGNGNVINDFFRAKNSCASRALDTFCVTSSPKHELK